MTLVEVVGGLGLLATLLVALLLAKARYTRQAAAADRRLQAVAAADALLAGWHQDPRSLVRAGGGAVAGGGEFSWRTQRVDNAAVSEMGAAVVRLEILDERPEAVAADRVITSVEFVVDQEVPGAAAAATDGKKNTNTKPAVGAGKRPKAAAAAGDAATKRKNAKSLHNP
jgi:hypothetical protein